MSFNVNNKNSLKEEYDATINAIDKSQLPNEANDIAIREDYGRDMSAKEFSKGLDAPADNPLHNDVEPEILPEMTRFCFDRTEQIPKETLVMGKDSGRTPKMATEFKI